MARQKVHDNGRKLGCPPALSEENGVCGGDIELCANERFEVGEECGKFF